MAVAHVLAGHLGAQAGPAEGTLADPAGACLEVLVLLRLLFLCTHTHTNNDMVRQETRHGEDQR